MDNDSNHDEVVPIFNKDSLSFNNNSDTENIDISTYDNLD